MHCLDIGCGIGGVILDIADFGAKLTGVTIAPNEAEIGEKIIILEFFEKIVKLKLKYLENYESYRKVVN